MKYINLEKILLSIKKVFILAIILVVNLSIAACSANNVEVVELTTTSQSTASENLTSQASEETGSEESTIKLLGDRALSLIDAVRSGNEYDYFSSATKEIVGTEEDYKNSTKSDIYFIIAESHRSWENLQVVSVNLTSANSAEVTVKGDRKAEGIDYIGDEVTFSFVFENDEWKIDFSQK